MELVMLENVDKQGLLACVDTKKQKEQQQKEKECSVAIYDPKPQGIVDSAVLEKLSELRKAEREKIMTENTEREKLMNAVTLTDIPATIKKAGFHPDGSPKLAIAGLFCGKVQFILEDQKAIYRSERNIFVKKEKSLSVEIGEVEHNYIFSTVLVWTTIASFLSVMASTSALERRVEQVVLNTTNNVFMFGIILPLICFAVSFIAFSISKGFICLDHIKISTNNWVGIDFGFSTTVPIVPEKVLNEITGYGPFAILFEVTQGWEKIAPDPVVFRIITIYGQKFFEPVAGYDMTPLEKASLVDLD